MVSRDACLIFAINRGSSLIEIHFSALAQVLLSLSLYFSVSLSKCRRRSRSVGVDP